MTVWAKSRLGRCSWLLSAVGLACHRAARAGSCVYDSVEACQCVHKLYPRVYGSVEACQCVHKLYPRDPFDLACPVLGALGSSTVYQDADVTENTSAPCGLVRRLLTLPPQTGTAAQPCGAWRPTAASWSSRRRCRGRHPHCEGGALGASSSSWSSVPYNRDMSSYGERTCFKKHCGCPLRRHFD